MTQRQTEKETESLSCIISSSAVPNAELYPIRHTYINTVSQIIETIEITSEFFLNNI